MTLCETVTTHIMFQDDPLLRFTVCRVSLYMFTEWFPVQVCVSNIQGGSHPCPYNIATRYHGARKRFVRIAITVIECNI